MRVTRRHLAAPVRWHLPPCPRSPPPAHAESADEAAVRKAIDDLSKAMLAADKAKLEALVADQLSYGHSAGRLETKKEFIDVIAGKKTTYKSITAQRAQRPGHRQQRHRPPCLRRRTESDGKPAGQGRRHAGLGEGRRRLETSGAPGLQDLLITWPPGPP